jgi:chemotaxis protein MotB
MKRTLSILLAVAFAACALSACMMTSTHEEQMNALKNEHAGAMDKLTKERDAMKTDLEGKLKTELGIKNKMSAELAAKDMQIGKLLDEKGALSKERSTLSAEQKKMAQQIAELQRMKAAAEKRNAEFRTLLEKLRKMIDAGTLQVKVRNGLMLVQMSSDVVFPPASVRIKAEAKEALYELAQTISGFSGRRFQVIGHSDSNPIHTARFPSNWELSTQRAVEVVKLMIEAGVPPEMINAAGNAEFDPLTDNETPEGRTTNRRVEIIFLPRIDELPGIDQVLSK